MAFRTLFNPPLTPFDPTHRYFTSWLISPFALSLLRGIIALYVFVTLIYTLAYSSVNNPQRVGRHWSYFTNITNWSEAFYFLFAAGHGAWYARNGRVPLEQWWKLLRFAHGLLYTTVLTFPILVTLVYWIILAPSDDVFTSRFETWNNISVHALNCVWSLIEILIPRTEPPAILHLIFLILFLALYLALAYVTKETQGFYTYSFLDPGKGVGSLVGYMFGVLIGICVLFAIVWGVVWLRKWITEEKGGFGGKMAVKDQMDEGMGKADVEMGKVET
ncbi:hypothetical protein EX30DRAFT_340064 [Ascodesmis nigricans]|uniref:FAR-17a/AIG1-like protein n=1 Tax=Ascodesmis nigricans TaxID=341454 RepID=A0A4V3SJ11_9PEZI|nr:hypothetical protein EX30DRAFT_340064 [Ascodesmis nigricans]